MSAGIPIRTVDAFTARPFAGNPAAVCLLPEERPAEWRQAIAAEMNLAETAFVQRRSDGGFSIGWFTPTVEVPLCGHATLASAHVLWEESLVPKDQPIRLHSKSGLLTAFRERDWICLDFPALPARECPTPAGLMEALGCRAVTVRRTEFPAYLVETDSENTVRELTPDIARLRQSEFNVCIVTARGESRERDFVSRFFAPGIGIDEDPVTGAAHCSLAPYWAEKLGKTELTGHQLSKRGGVVRVRALGERVSLLGQAITVLHGEILR